jgi:tRNA (guanine-N7-)-methyltransferase
MTEITKDGLAPPTRRHFYGRSVGKALRQQQAAAFENVMERLQLEATPITAPLATLFEVPVTHVGLEIGFGGGEHLLHMLTHTPELGMIGGEVFRNGVAKVTKAVQETPELGQRLRLYNDDINLLLPHLPDASLDAVYVLYPDPWPKRRQRKRRLIREEFLEQIARLLKVGGHFYFASDIDDYIGWTLTRVAKYPQFHWCAQHATDWFEPYPFWRDTGFEGTRYETKAKHEGRIPSYLTFERR